MNQFEIIEVGLSDKIKVYQHIEDPILLVSEGNEYLTREQAQHLLAEVGVQVILLVKKVSDRYQIRCLSLSERIRALEVIDYVFGQFGIAKGTAEWAEGSVSDVLLSVCISEAEVKDATEYFLIRADEYFSDCEVVEAATYAQMYPEQIAEMKEYEKAKVSWAFVKTTDIAPEGTQLSIRTLENDTGVLVETGEDIYVMIGCMGEVYQIQREKFEASYEVTKEQLDIFDRMFEFIPAVEKAEDHTYLPIDEQAKICYPKKGPGILAKQLTARTRVFAKNGCDYFVGDPGDYMAVRKDDPQDIYIIRKEVFGRTYVEKDA